MPDATQWSPVPERDEGSEEVIHVDASQPFRHPIRCLTTRRELYSLVQRLKSETPEGRSRVSNDKFRRCLRFDAVDHTPEELETFCGNVVVFHCCRLAIDGRPVPCLEVRSAPTRP